MKPLLALLLALCSVQGLQDKTADELLRAAKSEAKEKNRRILLTFGGPG